MSGSVETTKTLSKSDIELSLKELDARIDELEAKDGALLSDEELLYTIAHLKSAIWEYGRRTAVALGEDEQNPLIGSPTGNYRELIDEYHRRFPDEKNEFTDETEYNPNINKKGPVKKLLGHAARFVRRTN